MVPVVFGLTRATTFYSGLLALIAFEVLFRLYVIIDAVRNSRRLRGYVPKPYNTWYYHLLIATGMFTVLMVYDVSSVLGTQSFHIPSPSNNPTLQVGDRLIADMRAYEHSGPDYGDIVVYTMPDDQIYTFRVVGLPNDTLDLIDNVVSINGQTSETKLLGEAISFGMPVLVFEEELPNGHTHLICKFKLPHDSTMIHIDKIIVPSDSYYVLGDSRDNAADSRYGGFISMNRIKGRIIYSYWGATTDRINIDFRDK